MKCYKTNQRKKYLSLVTMNTFGFKTMECLDSEEGSFWMWGRVGDAGVEVCSERKVLNWMLSMIHCYFYNTILVNQKVSKNRLLILKEVNINYKTIAVKKVETQWK